MPGLPWLVRSADPCLEDTAADTALVVALAAEQAEHTAVVAADTAEAEPADTQEQTPAAAGTAGAAAVAVVGTAAEAEAHSPGHRLQRCWQAAVAP